jgi:Tetratricopeptide repeat
MNMLAAADPSGEEGRDVRMANLLDRALEGLDPRFFEQPVVEAALQRQSPPNEFEIASSLENVAIILADLGDLEDASEIQQSQVESYRNELGPNQTRLGRALANLGSVY